MISVSIPRLVATFSSAMLATISSLVNAKDDVTWPVKGKLIGKDRDKSKDVSGIACITNRSFPRSCLVIDDEVQGAQFATLNDGELRVGDTVELIDNHHGGKPLELDGEGVAYADGAFYVIGSHGYPRDRDKDLDPVADADKIKARIVASSQIIRIRLKPTVGQPLTRKDVKDIQSSSRLREAIAAEPSLKPFLDRPLQSNGVTIEGVAVVGKRLFAGFRGPTLDDGRVPVLSVSLDALFEGGALEPELLRLPLGEGRGIRDLASFDDGILILGGPSGGDTGPTVVYWWNASSENVSHLADITKATRANEDLKPEALLPLDQGPSGLRVLVLFDGAKGGAPRTVVIPAP